MSNLRGIITKSINNADMQSEQLGYITTNVANWNTYGYKCERFENFLREDGYIDGTIRTDYSNGDLYRTNRNLDIGINGAGFVPVIGKDGKIAYTRNGSFKVNKDGYIVTMDDSIVGEGIKLPANYSRLKIEKNGEVKIATTEAAKPELVGKIPLVAFNNPEGLKRGEGNNLLATKESGVPMLLENHNNINQGMVERSNINIFASVNTTLQLTASMKASVQMVKVADELYRQAINLKQ